MNLKLVEGSLMCWYKTLISALQSRSRQISDFKASFRPDSQDSTVRPCNKNVEEILHNEYQPRILSQKVTVWLLTATVHWGS